MSWGDPINLTDPEIKDRLDKWFGLRFASYPQPMIDGIKAIASLPMDDRERAADALKAFFCVHCGSPDTDCQCWNDE